MRHGHAAVADGAMRREPTIDNHVADCKEAGADVFVQLTYSKFAAQGIRKVAALGWKPLHIVNSNCSSIGGILRRLA